MASDSDRRIFTESKHITGQWNSKDILNSNPVIRALINFFSFKRKEIDRLASKPAKNIIAVNLGAEHGTYTTWFRGRNQNSVISVHWSFTSLKNSTKNNQNNLLLCADLHLLPIKPGVIDIAFSIDTIGHLSNQEKVLDEILRICRGGAKLFFHFECSDYKSRWPDSFIIKRTGRDLLSEYDCHPSLRHSTEIRALVSQRFHLNSFINLAGLSGWLTVYPEKYAKLFKQSGSIFFYVFTSIFVFLKKVPILRHIIKLINVIITKFEMFIRIEGGSSCFVQADKNYDIISLKSWNDRSIDIVIATYLRNDKIELLCSNLLKVLHKNDHIIVINQGPQLSLNSSEKVTLVNLDRVSLPLARNTGLSISNADIILFLDDDVLPLPGLLDAHRKCYDRSSTGAVAGFVDDPLFDKSQSLPSIYNEKTGEFHQNFSLPVSQKTISLMGANMSFRRDVLIKSDGFDINYTGNALYEEVDCAFRIRNCGYDIWYCSDARVIHERTETGGCRSEKRNVYIYNLFSNATYFACKYVKIDNLSSWLTFWKYRMEYLSRSNNKKLLKHDPLIISVSIAGFISGLVKYFCKSQYGIRRISK